MAGRGVSGRSTDTDGVQGLSENATGVFGEGPQNGVHGKSGTGRAVYGENTGSGDGVGGFSDTGTGTAGVSRSGTGIYGRSEAGDAGFFEGNVHVTGTLTCFDVVLTEGGDFAERFQGVGTTTDLAPGTVVVLDDDGAVVPSAIAYDCRVAGVIAGAGSLKPGILLAGQAGVNAGVYVSLAGTAYCKVDAQYSPIAVGDLLTTSPTPGHAMTAKDRGQAFGAVLAKALRPQLSGRGLIPVLVTMQ